MARWVRVLALANVLLAALAWATMSIAIVERAIVGALAPGDSVGIAVGSGGLALLSLLGLCGARQLIGD